jgi:hypothetical protein
LKSDVRFANCDALGAAVCSKMKAVLFAKESFEVMKNQKTEQNRMRGSLQIKISWFLTVAHFHWFVWYSFAYLSMGFVGFE